MDRTGDGEHIVLDEPFELAPNAPLAVTVLSPATPEHDAERAEWADLSAQSLARALGSIETDYINGEIVMLGRAFGVATPVNEAIQRTANELANRRQTRALSGAELRARIEEVSRAS